MLCRPDGRTLLVRKRGTAAFMQPGGKVEAGETPLGALLRELVEELGLVVEPARATALGSFAAPAANEPGRMVDATVFRIEVTEEVRPAAEIDAAVWVDAAAEAEAMPLAPLTRDVLLPLLARMAGLPPRL